MPVCPCIMPDCDAPTITYGLCSKHRYRAEVVGVIDWFAKGRPGAVEELERRWVERQNKRSPKPQGDNGGREIKVPFAGGEVTLGKVDPTPGDDGGPMVIEADAAAVDGFSRAMTEADAAPSPEPASVEGGVQPVEAAGAPRVVLLDLPAPGTYWRDVSPEDRARMPVGAVLGAPADHPDAGTLTRRSDGFWATRDGTTMTDGQVDNYRHLLSYPPAAGTIAERIVQGLPTAWEAVDVAGVQWVVVVEWTEEDAALSVAEELLKLYPEGAPSVVRLRRMDPQPRIEAVESPYVLELRDVRAALDAHMPGDGTIAERIEKLAQRVTPAPPGYDGALGAVQAALWMSPSTTVDDVVRVVEELRKRERAAQDAVDEIGALFHFVEKSPPGAVAEKVRELVDRARGQRNALDSLGAAVGLADGYGPMVVAETVLAELDRRAARIKRLEDEHARASALCVGVPATRVEYDYGEMKEVPLTLTERVRHLADRSESAKNLLMETERLLDGMLECAGRSGVKARVRAVRDACVTHKAEIARLRTLVERQADQLTVLVNAPYALTREELRQRCEDYARGERLVERALAPKREVAGGN